jgi:poly(hydroxyalkanoate) granule-associated protein
MKGVAMFEAMNKLMLSGLGLMSITRERAEEIFDELVQRGEAEKSQRGRFVEDLTGTAQRARKEFQDLVAKQVRDTIERLNLPTRDDLLRLEAKVDRLIAQGQSAGSESAQQ